VFISRRKFTGSQSMRHAPDHLSPQVCWQGFA
jgi:hypothetical protein